MHDEVSSPIIFEESDVSRAACLCLSDSCSLMGKGASLLQDPTLFK